MKIIVAGACGFVGTEVIRQTLRTPEITRVVALSRRPVVLPADLPADCVRSKLKVFTVEDYSSYPERVLKEFDGACGCIWNVAIKPGESENYKFEEVVKVNKHYTLQSLKIMSEAAVTKPFNFFYMSCTASMRGEGVPSNWLPEYFAVRKETEVEALEFATNHVGDVDVCVGKTGFISDPTDEGKTMYLNMLESRSWEVKIASVTVQNLAIAMINQVLNGFEKTVVLDADIDAIARRVKWANL